MGKGFKIPSFLVSEIVRYRNIATDPMRKNTSTELATLSLIYSAIAIVLTAILYLLTLIDGSLGMVVQICIILLVGIVGVISLICLLTKSAISIYYQFKLNKNIRLYFAIALFVVCLIAIGVAIYFISKQL